MWKVLVVAAVTGLSTGIGVVPFFFRDTIPRRVYDTILGLGAGLMIAAATLGLLAEALEGLSPGGVLDTGRLAQVLAGFTVGVVVMVAMDYAIPHVHAGGHGEHIGRSHDGHGVDQVHPHEHEHDEEVRHGLLISGAMTIHRIPEGFAIGVAFALGASESVGWVLAVAVAFQNMCEGAIMGAPLRYAGWSGARTLLVVLATGLAVPVAAMVGYFAASSVAGALPFALSLAAGALIYLMSNEVIPETHSHGNEKLATLGLVAGFLLVIIVKAMGHTH